MLRCNTLNDLSKVCIPSKTEDKNLSVFDIVTGINESKTFAKLISCESKCNLLKKNVFQINGGITMNVNVNVKNVMYVKKIILGILPHEVVKMENIYQVLWMIQRLCVMRL